MQREKGIILRSLTTPAKKNPQNLITINSLQFISKKRKLKFTTLFAQLLFNYLNNI